MPPIGGQGIQERAVHAASSCLFWPGGLEYVAVPGRELAGANGEARPRGHWIMCRDYIAGLRPYHPMRFVRRDDVSGDPHRRFRTDTLQVYRLIGHETKIAAVPASICGGF